MQASQTEIASELDKHSARDRPKPCQAAQIVAAADFEVIRTLGCPRGGSEVGELVLGRRVQHEQKALRLIVQRAIPFVPQLRWSFQDEKALYLVMVGQFGCCQYANSLMQSYPNHRKIIPVRACERG